jgi:hypothetical protein
VSGSSSPPSPLCVVDLIVLEPDRSLVYLLGSDELSLIPSTPWVGGEGYAEAAKRIASDILGCAIGWPAISEITAVTDDASTVIHFTISAALAGPAPAKGRSVPIDKLPESLGAFGRRQVPQALRVQRIQVAPIIVDVLRLPYATAAGPG